MDDVFVASLMTTDLHTAGPETLVETAAGQMLEAGVGSLLVVDDAGHLEGILTTTDFVRIVAERKPKDETPVSVYMTEDVVTATAQDLVEEVADTMVEYGIHHVPVVDDDGVVIGIVTTTDLTAYLSDATEPSPA
ncbi:MAG: CBS domain-containing protein [Halobacteriaceae archaeon]